MNAPPPLTDTGAAAAAAPPALAAAHVAFAYGPLPVLRDVDLAVARGAMLALAGPNGSGKSTLLALLAGTRPAAAGTVSVAGRPIAAWERRALARTIAVVPQETRVLFPYTVAEIVLMGRAPHRPPLGLEGARDVAIAEDVMTETGIRHLASRRITELSGGERQRVAVARALVLDPALVLADEPTGNLDPATGEKIGELLLGMNRNRGTALVVVTHNERLAQRLGRIATLVGGGLVEGNAVREA